MEIVGMVIWKVKRAPQRREGHDLLLSIRWSKGIKPGTEVKQIASVLDLLPTLGEQQESWKNQKEIGWKKPASLLNDPNSKDLNYLKSIVCLVH